MDKPKDPKYLAIREESLVDLKKEVAKLVRKGYKIHRATQIDDQTFCALLHK